jgi:hypothetical protein
MWISCEPVGKKKPIKYVDDYVLGAQHAWGQLQGPHMAQSEPPHCARLNTPIQSFQFAS